MGAWVEGPSRNVPGRGPGNHAAAWSHRLSLPDCTQLRKQAYPCFSQSSALLTHGAAPAGSREPGLQPSRYLATFLSSSRRLSKPWTQGTHTHMLLYMCPQPHKHNQRQVSPQALTHTYSQPSLTLMHTHIDTQFHTHTHRHHTQTCSHNHHRGLNCPPKRYVDILVPSPSKGVFSWKQSLCRCNQDEI